LGAIPLTGEGACDINRNAQKVGSPVSVA
jgi:hypothetical protein